MYIYIYRSQKRTSDLLKLRVTDGDELPDIGAGV